VDLVEVDVVHPEPLQRCVDRGEDVLARQAAAVGARRHLAVDLGCDDHLVAAQQLAHQPAGGDLAGAL
jgi:hypothetical protein